MSKRAVTFHRTYLIEDNEIEKNSEIPDDFLTDEEKDDIAIELAKDKFYMDLPTLSADKDDFSSTVEEIK
jgi:hypothetical protein